MSLQKQPERNLLTYIAKHKKIADKSAGANNNGNLTGVYQSEDGRQTILFKQGKNEAETIAEFVAAGLYNTVLNGLASECLLAYPDNSQAKNIQDNAKQIYVGSVFFQEFTEIFKDAGFKSREKFTRLLHHHKTKKLVSKYKNNEDFHKVLASSLWLGDYDIHWGNFGSAVINGKKRIVKIDHGWSLYKLRPKIDFLKHFGHLTPGKPTNHFWDFAVNDCELYLSDKFSKALDDVASINIVDIEKTIQQRLDEAAKLYDDKYLINFARRSGINQQKLKEKTGDELKTIITTEISSLLKQRQDYLKNLSTAIKLENCITQNPKTKKFNIDIIELNKIYHKNPNFFADNKLKYKFRKAENKLNTKVLTEIINQDITIIKLAASKKSTNNIKAKINIAKKPNTRLSLTEIQKLLVQHQKGQEKTTS